MATIDKSKPSIFGNINAYFRPMFSKEKVPTYNEMEDHVPIVDIYDRFLIDKYGCVSALYMIDAPAADVASADQLTLIQNQLCSMIDNLPESILQLQFIFATAGSYKDLILKHASYESVFPIANSIRKKTAELLIEESRNRRVVKNSTILALSCAPKTIGAGGVLSEFKIDGKTGQTTIPAKAITKTQCMESISTLETSEGLIEDCFGRVGITARPMTASEIAEYFYSIYNQTRLDIGIPVNYDYDTDPFNESWMCEGARFAYDYVKIGDYYHGFISMEQKPQESTPRLIEQITTESGLSDMRVTTSIRRLDRSHERDLLIKHRNREMLRMSEPQDFLERLKSPSAKADPLTAQYHVEAKDNVQDANKLLSELRSGDEFLALCQTVVHFWTNDLTEFRRRRDILVARFSDMNRARGIMETVGTYQLFKSTMPASMAPMPRWVKVKGRMAADLIPLSCGFELKDDPVCIFHSATNGLVPLNLYQQGVSNAPITFISGSPGSGKSFVANMLLVGHMIEEPLVIILDIGGSYNPLVELMGGQVLTFNLDNPFCFNPLQVYGGKSSVVQQPDPATRTRINRSLEALMTYHEHDPGGVMPQHLIALIDRATEGAFAEGAARGVPYIKLSDVMRRFQDHEDSHELARRIRPFTKGEEFGDWFDGPSTVDLKSKIVCFDLQGIKKVPRLCKAFFPLLINYVYDLIITNRGARKILLMDEMWEFISNERMAHFVTEAWKTFRKENTVVIGITQNLAADIAANEKVGSAIIQSTETWFLLNQGKATDNINVGKILNLSDGEMDILCNLKAVDKPRDGGLPYREALLIRAHSRNLSGKIRIVAIPDMRWLGTTRPDERNERDAAKARLGDIVLAIEYLARKYPIGIPNKRT